MAFADRAVRRLPTLDPRAERRAPLRRERPSVLRVDARELGVAAERRDARRRRTRKPVVGARYERSQPEVVDLNAEIEDMAVIGSRAAHHTQRQRTPTRASLVRDAPGAACGGLGQRHGRRPQVVAVVVVLARGDREVPGTLALRLQREPLHQVPQVAGRRREVRRRNGVAAAIDIDRARVHRIAARISQVARRRALCVVVPRAERVAQPQPRRDLVGDLELRVILNRVRRRRRA